MLLSRCLLEDLIVDHCVDSCEELLAQSVTDEEVVDSFLDLRVTAV